MLTCIMLFLYSELTLIRELLIAQDKDLTSEVQLIDADDEFDEVKTYP